ncbi:MAG: hypothetical protein P8015_18175 [Acidihalobacter sp.]
MNTSKQLLNDLRRARFDVVPIPLSEERVALEVGEGYHLQRQGFLERAAHGEALTGWKVAFSNSTAQRRLGLEEPVYGILTDHMWVQKNGYIDATQLIQPKLEVELGLVIGRDMPQEEYDDLQLLDAIDCVIPAFEVADCRWSDWRFSAGEFLADNAATGRYCLGDPLPSAVLHMNSVQCSLEVDGQAVGGLTGRPHVSLHNFTWLMRRLLLDGYAVRAGQVILSGALFAPVDVRIGIYRLQMLETDLTLQFCDGR